MKYKTITFLILLLFLQSCTTLTSKDVYNNSIKKAEKYCNMQITSPPLIFISHEAYKRLAITFPVLKGGMAAHIPFNTSCMIVVIDKYKNSRYEKGLYDHELGHHIFHCIYRLTGRRESERFARKYSGEF